MSAFSNSNTFVPLTSVFEKTDIGIQSIGIVSRLVEYIGVIVPPGWYTAHRVTLGSTSTITGGLSVVLLVELVEVDEVVVVVVVPGPTITWKLHVVPSSGSRPPIPRPLPMGAALGGTLSSLTSRSTSGGPT